MRLAKRRLKFGRDASRGGSWLAVVVLIAWPGAVVTERPGLQDRAASDADDRVRSTNGTARPDQVVQNHHPGRVGQRRRRWPAGPWLAESWIRFGRWLTLARSASDRTSTFHDGTPLTAASCATCSCEQLAGEHWDRRSSDVESIERRLQPNLSSCSSAARRFCWKHSTISFIARVRTPEPGPFYVVSSARRQSMSCGRTRTTTAGKPPIDRIVIQPYTSVRAAWADMLRGQVDMLYEVGSTPSTLVKPANEHKDLHVSAPYALRRSSSTSRKPGLKDAAVRRALNAAIDRDELVAKRWTATAVRPMAQYGRTTGPTTRRCRGFKYAAVAVRRERPADHASRCCSRIPRTNEWPFRPAAAAGGRRRRRSSN